MTYVYRVSFYATLALLVLLSNGSLQADPLTVAASVMPQGDTLLYNFAITNQSSTDPYDQLVSVDFPFLPSGSIVGNAIAPSGFDAVTNGDYILFAYSNAPSFPVGSTTAGFQFVDTLNLSSISFEANYLNATETQLNVFTGTVSPGGTPAAVPEPSTWMLLGGAFLILLGSRCTTRVFSRLATGAQRS